MILTLTAHYYHLESLREKHDQALPYEALIHAVWGGMWVCVLSHLSRVQHCVTLWAIACQTLLSMAFSRQEYWSGSPCPSLGDHPNPGTEHIFLISPIFGGGSLTTGTTSEAENMGNSSVLKAKASQVILMFSQ